MKKIVFSATALAEINAIWEYTVEEWGSAQADRYNRLIESACIALADGTQSGQSAEHILAGYRTSHVGRRSIYFRLTETDVEVVRVLHQSMDVEIHLG